MEIIFGMMDVIIVFLNVQNNVLTAVMKPALAAL